MKTIKVTIEKSADFYDGFSENVPGIYGAGASVEEVKKSILEAIALQSEIKDSEYEIEYKYDVQSFLNYYSKVFSMPALEKLTGINQKQLHHYASGLKKPRQIQKDKIENALHSLGKELISVNL